MTVRIAQDSAGRILLQIHCDGCHRVAGSDSLTPAELCRLISWDCDLGVAYCFLCQRRRHRRPEAIRRLRRR